MVATIEQQTGIQPNQFEPAIDRSDGRSIFIKSQEFYMEHADILPQKTGLVVMIDSEESNDDLARFVILDAREHNPGALWQSITWEYNTHNQEGIRQVRQLTVDSFGAIKGWMASYNAQGAATEFIEMDAETCETVWFNILVNLSHPSVAAEAEICRLRKIKILASLDDVIEAGKISETGAQKRREVANNLGFTALTSKPSPIAVQ